MKKTVNTVLNSVIIKGISNLNNVNTDARQWMQCASS